MDGRIWRKRFSKLGDVERSIYNCDGETLSLLYQLCQVEERDKMALGHEWEQEKMLPIHASNLCVKEGKNFCYFLNCGLERRTSW